MTSSNDSVKETKTETKTRAEKPAESVYSAEELANNYKVFKTYREQVVVALRLAGVDKATLPEAIKIVEKFKRKEVK